ncbi:MAG: phosphate-selective porin [Candidatus Latescibacterota bacterium]
MLFLLSIVGLLFCIQAGANENVSFKVRLQPRLAAGDIIRSADRTGYETETDAYLRRARLEIVGRPRKNLLYIVAFSGDRWDQKGRANEIILGYALVDYKFSDPLSLQLGLAKLPYSRGTLTSSSRLLLVDRPAVADMGARFFKYFAPHIVLHGKFANGALAYNFALSDGFQAGDSDRAFSGKTVVTSGDPGGVLRIEWSPAGWIEKRKSDSHQGLGQHLTLGLNTVWQNDIGLEDIGKENRLLLGADLSYHRKGLSLQSEYLYMKRDSASEVELSGWYVQGGYFFINRRIEPAFRFDLIDENADTDDDQTKIFTGGINWYIEGHALKVQANIFHHIFDTNAREVSGESSKTGLLIQNQIYF